MPRAAQAPHKLRGVNKKDADAAASAATAASQPDAAAATTTDIGSQPTSETQAPARRKLVIKKPLGVAPKQKSIGKRKSDRAIKRAIRLELARADRVRAIPRAPLTRVIRELAQKYSKSEDGLRLRVSAIDAIQTAAEAMMINTFVRAEMVRMARKQKTLAPIDIKTVQLVDELR